MTFADSIAEEIKALQKLVPTPLSPYGYGADLSCVTDLTPTLSETDQNSAEGIKESLLRRLQTPSGWLADLDDDPNYGLDIVGLLNHGLTTGDLNAMEGQIRSECLKDDRINSLTVSVSYSLSTKILDVKLRIDPKSPNLNTFDLTVSITEAGELNL